MLYHPMATYISSFGKKETLFVSTAALSMEQAERAIKVWRDDYNYNLTAAWVDVYENGELIQTVDKSDLVTRKGVWYVPTVRFLLPSGTGLGTRDMREYGVESMEHAERMIKEWCKNGLLTAAWVEVWRDGELIETVDKSKLISLHSSVFAVRYKTLKILLNKILPADMNVDAAIQEAIQKGDFIKLKLRGYSENEHVER